MSTGALTNTFDVANRLVETSRSSTTLEPIYNGVNDRVGQVTDGVTTTFALDVQGLPEVIYTSDDEAYLHLPGVIVTEKTGEVRYLLSDGLGSVRQAVNETADVIAYYEFDPYGNPVENGGEPYGFSGEWWENDVGLLHLRARWYSVETGTFLSVDPVESEPPYLYANGNPTNQVDPSGMCAQFGDDACWNVYEQIIALCPECAAMTRPTLTGNRRLHQENIQYLQTILERVRAGWRPLYQPARPGQDDRDLTLWLFRELKAGMQNTDVKYIKGLREGVYRDNYGAGTRWAELVRDEARYDFKHDIEAELGQTILFRANDGTELWTEFSVPGNIFFGFMSDYIGFPRLVVRAGAGQAQLKDHFKDGKSICELLPTAPYLFDGPDDYRAISVGFKLHQKYGRSLTLFQFRDELAQNYQNLTPPPELPGNGSTPAYGWRNSIGGWPYREGRFNGPSEFRFWPNAVASNSECNDCLEP